MLNTNSLPAFVVTGPLVWTLFALVVALWVTATLVLEYHWGNYAVDNGKITSVRFLYRAGSFFLIAVIFLSALSYSLS